MVLKGHDLVVALHAALHAGAPMSLAAIGAVLGLAASEVHASVQRATTAHLLAPRLHDNERTARVVADRMALIELVTHGARYVYLVERGPLTRGFATAHGAEPLKSVIRSSEPVPVWPHPGGDVRGESFSPLYKNAHLAAHHDPRLYRGLALIDALRGGRARERNLAAKMFSELVTAGAVA